MSEHTPGPFTHYCPNGKADERYAHDVTDSMPWEAGPRFLYCRRCGQAAPLDEAMEATFKATHPVRDAA